MKLLFDIETNGLLDTLNTIHCLVIKDVASGQIWSLHGDKISQGLDLLTQAEEIIGHNIIHFDIPAIQKIHPNFEPKGRVLDTLVLSRLLWPCLADSDYNLVKKGVLPPKLNGRYSLEAFGHRLKKWKGDYAQEMKAQGLDPWGAWSKPMQDYCEQDVEVNHLLYERALRVWAGYDSHYTKLRAQYLHRRQHPDDVPLTPVSDKSVWLEMDVAKICARQTRWGFGFDREGAEQLYVTLLSEREKLEKELKEVFGAWFAADGDVVTVKRTRHIKKTNTIYREGNIYQKIKYVEFNPASTHHIASRLKVKYGWQPQEFTPSGQPKLDETILSKLPFEEAKLLSRYMLLNKRIGQIAEGTQAWLKQEKQGRIHGSVNTLGAVTRRMTHSHPNIAQVPSNGSPFGEECRALFQSSSGYQLVGCDADALELRCLAGYMAKYDGGDYIKTILEGNKTQGTDMHSRNARALELEPTALYPVDSRQMSGRDIAKTWFYAFLYGAGDEKLGATMGATGSQRQIIQRGKQARASFLRALPALDELIIKVRKKACRGYLLSLDGSKLAIRSPHAALNTLLQSAGAIIMKQALVLLDSKLQQKGLIPSVDYEFCANVHDEWQIDVKPTHVSLVMAQAEWSIEEAGRVLNFACPLKGNAACGRTWHETH